MPELPEVETTKRGLEPHIVGRQVLSTKIYQKQLRWEVPSHLPTTIKGGFIKKISRRATVSYTHLTLPTIYSV